MFNEQKNGEIKLRKRFKKSNNWCSSIKHRSNNPNLKISVVIILKNHEWLNLWRNIYSIIDYDEAKERLQTFICHKEYDIWFYPKHFIFSLKMVDEIIIVDDNSSSIQLRKDLKT